MPYLLNTWYVAMWADDLTAGQLVSRTICEEPVVLYRGEGGAPTALADRCSHRFVPLSMGRVCEGTNHVECPYHGLQFGTDGTCVRNPHGTGRIPRTLDIRSYPVVERHSLLWVWMGDAVADATLIPDFSYLDGGAPGIVSKRDWMTMAVDYELVVDNLLDLSHVAFLHRGILGDERSLDVDVEIAEDGNTLTVTRTRGDVEPSPMFDLMYRNDGLPVDSWSVMRWNAPGLLVHDAGVCPPGAPRETGMTVLGTHLLTPSIAGTSYYHFAAVRLREGESPADHDPALADKLSAMRRYAFDEQDRPILEAQQLAYDRAGGRDALRPVMLSIDAAPLRARRILGRMIAAEAQRPGAADAQPDTLVGTTS